ncbi:MAG TPA: pyrrolo-quinoline quinone, partial [Anaerolineae bacterium]|nr:pyrrolo-quinoline quinone [Anaerolineae bacterium]
NGTAVWRVHKEGIFNAPRSEPVVADGRLYFQSNDNRLYSLDAAGGNILWQTEPQPRSRVAPAAAYGRLYLLGQDGVLYAYGSE